MVEMFHETSLHCVSPQRYQKLRSGSSFEMIKDLAIKQRVFIITLFFYVNSSQ